MRTTSINKYGLFVTLSVHVALASILVYIGITTPTPPPPDLGIMVNFGDGETGLGNTEPAEAIQDVALSTPPPSTSSESDENVINQDFEDAPVLKENKTKTQIKNTTTTENVKKTNTPTTEQPKVPERTVNKRALYSGKNSGTSTGSEGVAGGTGNQGSKFGSVDSKNHANGDSRGNGNVSFSLSGRNPLRLPHPDYNYQTEGKVVVEITVDKQGKVTKAVAGVRGSTTLDERLLEAAERAAKLATFDVSANAPAYQKGSITYHFMLR